MSSIQFPNPQLHTHESTSKEIVNISITLSAAIGVLAVLLIGVSAVLAALALGLEFLLWASGIILGGAGLLVAAMLIMGWENARWVLVETIAANTSKTRAEAARIEAEADAISGANTAIIQNVNAAEGSKVKANIQAPRVSLRGKLVSWNQMNQLNQAAPEVRTLEIPALDVIWFAEQLANGYPHSKRKWLGQQLPNSRLTMDYAIYRALVDPLTEADKIVGRGDRSAGKLVETNATALARVIDPEGKGLVLELPSETGLETGT